MLQIKNMSYRLLGETKEEDFELHNINFTLEQGFLMGLLGLNGSGKSTLMNLILGVYTPDKGSIMLDEPTANLDPHDRVELLRWCFPFLFLKVIRRSMENMRRVSSLSGILYM